MSNAKDLNSTNDEVVLDMLNGLNLHDMNDDSSAEGETDHDDDQREVPLPAEVKNGEVIESAQEKKEVKSDVAKDDVPVDKPVEVEDVAKQKDVIPPVTVAAAKDAAPLSDPVEDSTPTAEVVSTAVLVDDVATEILKTKTGTSEEPSGWFLSLTASKEEALEKLQTLRTAQDFYAMGDKLLLRSKTVGADRSAALAKKNYLKSVENKNDASELEGDLSSFQ